MTDRLQTMRDAIDVEFAWWLGGAFAFLCAIALTADRMRL